MSKEKRGGARLSQSEAPKKKAPHQNDALKSSSSDLSGEQTPSEGKRLSKKAKIAIIVVICIVTILLILFAVYKSWAKLPEVPDLPTIDAAATPDPDTGIVPSNQPVVSDRKENFYTFLVVGKDTGGGGNTDTMMLAAYDIPNQKLSVMSLPRDTMIDPRHPDKNHKLNAVWNLGLYYAEKDSKKQGQDYLKEAICDLMGFAPDFYVAVNWEAFGRLVDAIGGVDFEVPFDMQYTDPTQNLVINQSAGLRHLSGDDAMQVVRWRHNNSYSSQYADGDLGRIRTQQALMKEIVKQCLQIKNITKINEFAEIFAEEVETDLTVGNLVAFAERAILGGLSMDNVTFTTLPVSGVSVNGQSYVQVKPEEMLELLNESFNPYKEDLEFANLDIIQYSASSGYYTYKDTGKSTASKTSAASSATPASSAKPTSTPSSSAVTSAPVSASTPKPSTSPRPAETSTPKPSSASSSVPTHTSSAEPTSPSATPEPTEPEALEESAEPTSSASSPEPSNEPAPEETPVPSQESTPEPTPAPTPAPTPTPEPTLPPADDNGLPPGVPMG